MAPPYVGARERTVHCVEGSVMGQSVMTVAIDRPLEQVFAFVANAETAPSWQTALMEVLRTSDGAIGVGTTYRAWRAELREHVAVILEITAYEMNTKVSFERVWGEVRCCETYTFRAIGDGTRVTYAFDVASGTRATRHAFSKEAADLSNLKNALEAQTHGPRSSGRASQPAPRTASVARLPRAAARPATGNQPIAGRTRSRR